MTQRRELAALTESGSRISVIKNLSRFAHQWCWVTKRFSSNEKRVGNFVYTRLLIYILRECGIDAEVTRETKT
ncbi:hypothetical protein [Methylorubrum extorquens]